MAGNTTLTIIKPDAFGSGKAGKIIARAHIYIQGFIQEIRQGWPSRFGGEIVIYIYICQKLQGNVFDVATLKDK